MQGPIPNIVYRLTQLLRRLLIQINKDDLVRIKI